MNRIMVPASILNMAVDQQYFHRLVVSALNGLPPRVEEAEDVMPAMDSEEEDETLNPPLYPVSPRCIFDTEVTALDMIQVNTLPEYTFIPTEELLVTLPASPSELLSRPVSPSELPATLPVSPSELPPTLPVSPVMAPHTPVPYRMKRAGPIEDGETDAPKRLCVIKARRADL
jgi:hypothetical protein